jgi:hypothetical protein
LPNMCEPLGLKSNTKKKFKKYSQVPVAHSCNPSYSGGRDQEDQVSKLDWPNSSRDLILIPNAHTEKNNGRVTQV